MNTLFLIDAFTDIMLRVAIYRIARVAIIVGIIIFICKKLIKFYVQEQNKYKDKDKEE